MHFLQKLGTVQPVGSQDSFDNEPPENSLVTPGFELMTLDSFHGEPIRKLGQVRPEIYFSPIT